MDSAKRGRRMRPVKALLPVGVLAVVALASAGSPSALASARCDHLGGGKGGDAYNGRVGPDCLRGGPGADFLDGGPGGDKLLGGSGPDQLLAGAGRDRVSGGPGNDLISARDGRADSVRCGPGNDLASVDAGDDLIGCEKVRLNAPQDDWMRINLHLNAYGKSKLGGSGWGKCTTSNSQNNSCTGRAEVGNPPFNGYISMDWNTVSYASGQEVSIKSTDAAPGTLLGFSDPGWVHLSLSGGRVPQWVDPNNGIFRTGSDLSKIGQQGGPLQAFLGFHGFSAFEAKWDGYSLDLQGWIRIIRF
jgi:hypothetical protein